MYTEIYLLLTTNCNNRCKYCYIKHDPCKPQNMETSDAIGYILKYKPTRVILFGGEPLLRLNTIKEIYAYFKDKEYKPKFQIVTSATVNFKEFVEFALESKMFNEIQLSWDGPSNTNRVNVDNYSIANDVYSNILLASSNKLKFDIKCVISEDNIDQLETIHSIFVAFKDANIGISGQFVIAHRDYYSKEFFYSLSKNLIKTFDLNKMYSDHLNKIIAYLQKDKNYSNCDAGKYMVITPDGRVSYCTALSQNYDLDFSQEELQKPCLHEDCIKCEYNYLCDGGCRYERYNKYGADWRYHYLDTTCKLVKIYNDTIKEYLYSLSDFEKQKLLSIIERYKKYQKEYHSSL